MMRGYIDRSWHDFPESRFHDIEAEAPATAVCRVVVGSASSMR
jgi:hypothetical protein